MGQLWLRRVLSVHAESSRVGLVHEQPCGTRAHLSPTAAHAQAMCAEFMGSRHLPRMWRLSEQAQARVRAALRGFQSDTIVPELHTRFSAPRPCRDLAHMVFNQLAHFSPRLTLEEQIIGGAGGGIVKKVGS